MKKLIILSVFVSMSINFVNSQTLKSISSLNSTSKTKDTLYTSFSFGSGICIDNSKLKPGFEINAGIRHQFSVTFFLEGKFDYISTKYNIYILSAVPQWSLYNNNSISFLLGTGLEFIAISKEGAIILPIGLARLDINIAKDFFIFPEFRFPPFLASINFGYRIPHQFNK